MDGVRFVGAGVADVVGITSFTLGMPQMPKFTVQPAPSTFGFLPCDAANGPAVASTRARRARSHWLRCSSD